MRRRWSERALFCMVLAVSARLLCAQVSKDIRIDSGPPGALIETLVGTHHEPAGQTPATYHAEFHSEASVLRLLVRKPGYLAREIEISAKDDHVSVQLQQRSFTLAPSKLSDPELRKLEEQLAVPTERAVWTGLNVQAPFEVDLAREIQVQRIDGDVYLIVPLLIGAAPAEYRRVGSGNATAFLADLWNQLGGAFAMPLAELARKAAGVKGIVLEADYSYVASGFGVGFQVESHVEMECQAGMKSQTVWDPCASTRIVSNISECVAGLVPKPVYDPCLSKAPVTHTALLADPKVAFAQAKSKVRYVGKLSAFGTATEAKDIYGHIGVVLTNGNGGVLMREGDLPAALVPAE
jgi:hypothetical protein